MSDTGVPVFRGNHLITMDTKGRVAVPKKFRGYFAVEDGGSRVVITTEEYEDCLAVYPLVEWKGIEERLYEHPGLKPDADEEARAKAEWTCRIVIGNATECEIDSHGRLLISPDLRKHASLDKQVRVVGVKEKFELWDESKWQARSAEEFALNKHRIRQARDNLSPARASPP